MHNRIGTNNLANGAVRYGVYNAAGQLQRYEYLRLEDEPLAEETPLLAENLLAAATIPKIWIAGDAPSDPTVDQALNKLAEPHYPVGAMLVTARQLVAPWHECDGSTFSQTEYPDLYAVLGGTTLPKVNYSTDTSTYIKMANA
jgi:hypothetical protein